MLDNAGVLSAPVILPIRPEDLTKTDPSRVSVHQTLGRDVMGWADNFGAGLPVISIAGTTGWRTSSFSGLDGAGAFNALHKMVTKDYHAAKQSAINRGIDPGRVILIFVDVLDNITYNVAPTSFVLRRSKSRPLLFQYNISLQAVSTSIDRAIPITQPNTGNPANGLVRLNYVVSQLGGILPGLGSLLDTALSFVDSTLGAVASTISTFTSAANSVFAAVGSAITDVKKLSTAVGNKLVGIASSLAQVGLNVFRVVSAIRGIPNDLKSKMAKVAAAFNEVLCIFANALKPRKVYEEYSGLYGASNCSSTTGGSPPSPYANLNVFDAMLPDPPVVQVSGSATSGISALSGMDPVLAPMPMPEIGRQLNGINEGVTV